MYEAAQLLVFQNQLFEKLLDIVSRFSRFLQRYILSMLTSIDSLPTQLRTATPAGGRAAKSFKKLIASPRPSESATTLASRSEAASPKPLARLPKTSPPGPPKDPDKKIQVNSCKSFQVNSCKRFSEFSQNILFDDFEIICQTDLLLKYLRLQRCKSMQIV